MLVSLPACQTNPRPVETRIVEVPVETVVPLKPELTATEAAPSRPALRCKDAKGRSTLCNRDLVAWLLDYAALVDRLNAKLRAIAGLQPEPATP